MEKRTLRQWWNNDGGPWLMLGAMVVLKGLQVVFGLPRQVYYKVLDAREKRKKATSVA